MPARKQPDRLKSYHELKMSGEFSAEAVEELIETAAAISLGRIEPTQLPVIPLEEVRLYDVSHTDTGNRRPLTRSGDTVRIYRSAMREVTTRPLKAARFALKSIALEGVGASRNVRADINGRLLADLDDRQVDIAFSQRDIEAIRQTLAEPTYTPEIFGTLAVGHVCSFGEPTFSPPPNENYDSLITLGSFYDERYIVPQR